VGDASCFEYNGHTLPALVEAALQTGKGAALNVLNDIRGKEREEIKPKLHGVMVSVGSFFAVAEIMGVLLPRFLAILMKYLVNIHYLFGIGGLSLYLSTSGTNFSKRNRINSCWKSTTPSPVLLSGLFHCVSF